MATEPSTYGALHAGDIVLGADANEWGVAYVGRPRRASKHRLEVELVRHGESVTGYPASGERVDVVHRADTSAEHAAAGHLLDAGLQVELIGETWESGS